jgi:tRNA threonylcarbamoyl adenosine modification protein (Sua5/YciO/YrdC/YwlC family)
VSLLIDCTTESGLDEAIEAARTALANRECVVLPTDTVYGIGADAFSPQAVAVLLAAKGRGRAMPPPVLIGSVRVMDGLAVDVPQGARDLAEEFWPGALTLILQAQPSLTWDLGETRGTVALRVPDDQVARELLQEFGPLAVSSANRTSLPAATTAQAAREMLGDTVSVYLNDGERTVSEPSTIIDCTVSPFRVVRHGALSHGELAAVVPDLVE